MVGNWNQYFAQAHRDLSVLERLQQKVYSGQMDTRLTKERQRREKILAYWKRHGLVAMCGAF
jgi:hypothetical protein